MRDYTDYRGSILENEKKLWNKGSTPILNFSYSEIEEYKKEIIKNLILKNVKRDNMLNILEVEIGKGLISMIMASEDYNVTSVDSNMNTIREVSDIAQKHKMNIDFRLMDKSALDFRDKSFDLVISSNITWELQSPKSAFREWRRVLKDDGVLIYFDSNWSDDSNKEGRPYLDKEILKECGFSYVNIDRSVYKTIFNADKVFPYKNEALFMVVAKK